MNSSKNTPVGFSRQFVWLLYVLLFFVPLLSLSARADHAGEQGSALQEVVNFQQIATEMRQKKLPLLVEFHGQGCPYCRELEEDFLIPMLDDPAYKDKILIRQVQLDFDADIVDFQGNVVSPSQFASRYGAYMTPTMVFLDTDGKEVAEKIIGFNTPSMFGGYLDVEIEKALTNVRAKMPSQ